MPTLAVFTSSPCLAHTRLAQHFSSQFHSRCLSLSLSLSLCSSSMLYLFSSLALTQFYTVSLTPGCNTIIKPNIYLSIYIYYVQPIPTSRLPFRQPTLVRPLSRFTAFQPCIPSGGTSLHNMHLGVTIRETAELMLSSFLKEESCQTYNSWSQWTNTKTP
mgnify:CR=1 FL=1